MPRLLQAAPDANFEIEAKFDSAVTIRYQQQGVMVEQGTGGGFASCAGFTGPVVYDGLLGNLADPDPTAPRTDTGWTHSNHTVLPSAPRRS